MRVFGKTLKIFEKGFIKFLRLTLLQSMYVSDVSLVMISALYRMFGRTCDINVTSEVTMTWKSTMHVQKISETNSLIHYEAKNVFYRHFWQLVNKI